MGKKSKKLKKTQDNELPSANVAELEPEDIISETNNSTDSVKKSKKKNRKRYLNGTIIEDAPVPIKSKEINDSDTLGIPTTMKIKKEKKKKNLKLHEQELSEEVQNDTDTNKLQEDTLDIPKKKKKKGKLLDGEDKPSLETCVEIADLKPQKNSKKEKNKNSLLIQPNADKEKTPKIQNEDTKQKNKKGKNKAKTGAPILNDEESKVREEDIDRFIDELDEEDNKQYEDWVKLLDDRLSKKQKTE